MSPNDHARDIAEIAIANTEMDSTRDYLARGRRHSALSERELRTQHASAFKAWHATSFGPNDRRRDEEDLVAELSLRGLQPDYGPVAREFEELIALAQSTFKTMSESEKKIASVSLLQSYFDVQKNKH